MKSSTSWPSWSRKYSATVSPVRATRARAPGGSFICPYTRATLEVLSLREMTPPSIISWYRSYDCKNTYGFPVPCAQEGEARKKREADPAYFATGYGYGFPFYGYGGYGYGGLIHTSHFGICTNYKG